MIASYFPGLIKKSSGVEGVAQRKRVSLTAIEIKALFTTPKELIAAPGSGRYIEVISIAGILDASAQYTGANAVELRYTNASGAKVTGDLAAAWLNSATDRVDVAKGAAVTAVANAAVVAAVPTANPGAGTGTVVLDILYRVIKFTE
jgi:hypothetical protein